MQCWHGSCRYFHHRCGTILNGDLCLLFAELHVHSAEVHTEELPYHPDMLESSVYEDMTPHAEEIHSFLIHKEGGGCLATQAEQQ